MKPIAESGYENVCLNSLKQGDALSSLLFSFALQYAIRRVQETRRSLN